MNERVFEVQGSFSVAGPTEFFCECVDERCSARLEVPREQFEWVRTQEQAWIVVPGHEAAGETVLRRSEGYLVVTPAASVSESGER